MQRWLHWLCVFSALLKLDSANGMDNLLARISNEIDAPGVADAAYETGPIDAAYETGPTDAAYETGPTDAACKTGPTDAAYEAGATGATGATDATNKDSELPRSENSLVKYDLSDEVMADYLDMNLFAYKKNVETVCKYKIALAKKNGHPPPKGCSAFFGDVLMSTGQASDGLESLKRRHKRKVVSEKYRWDIKKGPIKYEFAAHVSGRDRALIKKAIDVWTSETCLRFQQVSGGGKFEGLRFQTLDFGCRSYVGNVHKNPQMINLETPGCLVEAIPGVALHEIGHALGLGHEQSRPDRDKYVTVNMDKIVEYAISNFDINRNIPNINEAVPYDYASVMHYGGKDFMKGSYENPENRVIETKDPSFQKSIGQRDRLTFYDVKAINIAYCADKCGSSLRCERDGYPNPNNCAVCKCPKGFAGKLCEKAAAGDQACKPLSSTIPVRNTKNVCLQSPSYPRGYSKPSACNWLLKAPTGCKILLDFEQLFSIPCRADHYKTDEYCINFIEIRHKAGLNERGARFCCQKEGKFLLRDSSGNVIKRETLTSETHEVLVRFDAASAEGLDFHTLFSKGFELCYRIANPSCLKTTTTPRPTPATPAPEACSPFGAWNRRCVVRGTATAARCVGSSRTRSRTCMLPLYNLVRRQTVTEKCSTCRKCSRTGTGWSCRNNCCFRQISSKFVYMYG